MLTSICENWKRDKLTFMLWLSWLLTVFFSFWYQSLLSFSLPMVGAVTPFRVLMLISLMLYLFWAVRKKIFFWTRASVTEKWCYVLIACLLLYSVISLAWAIDFGFSFHRLINLSLDLSFFFLVLQLCRDKKLLQLTLAVVAIVIAMQALIGIYEAFNGGVFSDAHDNHRGGYLFEHYTRAMSVSYGNPNDFASALTMCYGILLVYICKNWKEKKPVLILSISIPVLYFLLRLAQARLVIIAFYLLMIGFLVFLVLADKKRVKAFILSIVLLIGIYFVSEYRVIVPTMRVFWSDFTVTLSEVFDSTEPPSLSEPSNQPAEPSNQPAGPSNQPAEPSNQPAEPSNQPTEPSNQPTEPTVDPTQLQTRPTIPPEVIQGQESQKKSDAGRGQLLHFAMRCFAGSYGLGVGLGNTEMMLKAENPNGLQAVHCFPARIVADCGIAVLIPLCAIAWLLLKRIWEHFAAALRSKEYQTMGYCGVLFCCLVSYVFTSTSPSDAQDLLPMWLFLGLLVVFCEELKLEEKQEGTIE